MPTRTNTSLIAPDGSPINLAHDTSSAQLRSALSVLMDRMKFGAGLSRYSFGSIRDTWIALGYPTKLSPKLYRDSYERDDIAAAIVNIFPQATWIRGFRLQEDPDPEVTTEFEQSVETLYRDLSVTSSFMRADILSGLGDWSLIWIVADGSPETPLETSRIHNLFPVGQTNASIRDRVSDPQSPRFGEAESYDIQTDAGSFTVHWSRTLHVASGILDSRVTGTPELQSVWNRLEDLRKIVGGGAEAAWRRMDPGTVFNQDPSTVIDSTEASNLSDEIDEFYHGYRRYIRTRGMTVEPLKAFDERPELL